MTGLNVEMRDGKLVIEIDIPTLCFAVAHGPAFDSIVAAANGKECEITDERAFAEAILNELREEEEDGTTLVHEMLDKAAILAVEWGAEGIEIPQPVAEPEAFITESVPLSSLTDLEPEEG